MNRLLKNEILRYSVGFVLSLVLSFSAYQLVVSGGAGSYGVLAFWLLVLAGVQMILQVILFLHVGSEQKPRWHSYSYIFTWFMLLVLVIGSIWIMRNLNYNMGMTTDVVNHYMMKESQKGF